METKKSYRILMGKVEGNRQLGRLIRCRWIINKSKAIPETGLGGL
jgi:hypothetical protein